MNRPERYRAISSGLGPSMKGFDELPLLSAYFVTSFLNCIGGFKGLKSN